MNARSTSRTPSPTSVSLGLLAAASFCMQAADAKIEDRPNAGTGLVPPVPAAKVLNIPGVRSLLDQELADRRAVLQREMAQLMRQVLATPIADPSGSGAHVAPAVAPVAEQSPQIPYQKLTITSWVTSSALSSFVFVMVRTMASIGACHRRSAWELGDLSKGASSNPTVRNLLVSESFDGHTLPGWRSAISSLVALNARIFGLSGVCLVGALALAKVVAVPPIAFVPFVPLIGLATVSLGARMWAKTASWMSGLPVIGCSRGEANCATAVFGSVASGFLASSLVVAGLFSNLTLFACVGVGIALGTPLVRFGIIQMRRIEIDWASQRQQAD